MWIRYFACTDDSPLGRIALLYLKALCKVAEVRLVPLEVPVAQRWQPYVFGIPRFALDGPYVNVVCAPRSRWAWPQTVVSPASESRPSEVHRGTIELYTAGVRNVLIAPVMPPTELITVETAMKYEAVIVPPELREAWLSFRPDVHAVSEGGLSVSAASNEFRALIMG